MRFHLFKKVEKTVTAAAVTDCGKVRNVNQDTIYFAQDILKKDEKGFSGVKDQKISVKKPIFFGVFDGMGGLSDGEKASQLAAEEVKKIIKDCQNDSVPVIFEKICTSTNQIICSEMEKSRTKMGTTLSMLCFEENKVTICNVGDSPIFRYRNGELEKIYEEHTDRKIKIQLLGEEKLKGKSFSLTQYIGISEEEMQISPYLKEQETKTDDIYIICSDGLTDMLSEEEIIEILERKVSLYDRIVILKERANANGGKDNISIVGVATI